MLSWIIDISLQFRPLVILAFLVAAFFLVWVPRDFARLSHFERTMYTSFVFGTLAAGLAFVESWLRRSEPLLALAVLTAFVTARSYEAPIALLLAWPFFVAVALGERSRRFLAWAAAWVKYSSTSRKCC